MKTLKFVLIYGLVFFISCKQEEQKTNLIESEYHLSGGDATTQDASLNAFGNQVKGATGDEATKFEIGNSFFRSVWVIAPSSTSARDGLGPFLNANSCSSCHGNDGRGRPEFDKGLLLRLSVDGSGVHGEPKADSIYGGQLSVAAIKGVLKECEASVNYVEIPGNYADGTGFSLRKPIYTISNLNYGPLESNYKISPRVGQQVYGLGLLEVINPADILMNEDITDINQDGISGKANKVWSKISNQVELGRFGWKANQPNLFQQTSDAFNGDLGITSSLNPNENITGKTQKINYGSLITGGNPEIQDKELQAVVFYMQSLAVPARRNYKDADVIAGKKIFIDLGCHKCHTQKFQTGSSPINQLSNQTIYPYTDLLLHDMGDDLADGRSDFNANGNEWRTQALWGIGLIQTVNKHTFLLHDGRARNIEEAILWHGGESAIIIDKFKKTPKTERDKLIKFLENL